MGRHEPIVRSLLLRRRQRQIMRLRDTALSTRGKQMAATEEQGLRQRREATVREHVAAENRRDVDATIATFHSPSYEVNGERIDGEEDVRELLQGLMDGFPDFHGEIDKLHHADEAVFGEARITGTHNGEFNGIPPTGKGIDVVMAAVFDFEDDRLLCERVYYDVSTILRQIGILPEPTPA
jgi:steroid delta-isomerase-like uncharacterized protein